MAGADAGGDPSRARASVELVYGASVDPLSETAQVVADASPLMQSCMVEANASKTAMVARKDVMGKEPPAVAAVATQPTYFQAPGFMKSTLDMTNIWEFREVETKEVVFQVPSRKEAEGVAAGLIVARRMGDRVCFKGPAPRCQMAALSVQRLQLAGVHKRASKPLSAAKRLKENAKDLEREHFRPSSGGGGKGGAAETSHKPPLFIINCNCPCGCGQTETSRPRKVPWNGKQVCNGCGLNLSRCMIGEFGNTAQRKAHGSRAKANPCWIEGGGREEFLASDFYRTRA